MIIQGDARIVEKEKGQDGRQGAASGVRKKTRVTRASLQEATTPSHEYAFYSR
jgi:hypothetical protein